jgi:hypothetical protein
MHPPVIVQLARHVCSLEIQRCISRGLSMPLHPNWSHQITIYRTATLMLQGGRPLMIAVQRLIQILLCGRRYQTGMILRDLERRPLAWKLESATDVLI